MKIFIEKKYFSIVLILIFWGLIVFSHGAKASSENILGSTFTDDMNYGTSIWGPDFWSTDPGSPDCHMSDTTHSNFDLSGYVNGTISNATISWINDNSSADGNSANLQDYLKDADTGAVLEHWNADGFPGSANNAAIDAFLNSKLGGSAHLFWDSDTGDCEYNTYATETGLRDGMTMSAQPRLSFTWTPSGGADTTPPVVSITSPTNTATVSGTISITANASDNVGVTQVEFYYGTTLISTDTTSPYAASWNTGSVANGYYNLKAIAYDAAGNATTSAIVAVTVNNGGTTYGVTITQGSNGTIAALGTPPYAQGTNASFSIVANSTYYINSITIDGVTMNKPFSNVDDATHTIAVTDGATMTYTFKNMQANHTITAAYALDPYVTINAGANGTIAPASGYITYGNAVTYTVTASFGYHIVSITDTLGSTISSPNSPYSYVTSAVTANKTIAATFAINTYTVTFQAGSGGTLSGTVSQSVSFGGSTSSVTANANANFHFVNWTGDNSFSSTANPLTLSNVTANYTITANFAADGVVATACSAGQECFRGSVTIKGKAVINDYWIPPGQPCTLTGAQDQCRASTCTNVAGSYVCVAS